MARLPIFMMERNALPHVAYVTRLRDVQIFSQYQLLDGSPHKLIDHGLDRAAWGGMH